jgi:hypothetical protein
MARWPAFWAANARRSGRSISMRGVCSLARTSHCRSTHPCGRNDPQVGAGAPRATTR